MLLLILETNFSPPKDDDFIDFANQYKNDLDEHLMGERNRYRDAARRNPDDKPSDFVEYNSEIVLKQDNRRYQPVSRSPDLGRRGPGGRKIPNAANQFSRSIRNERAALGDTMYDGFKDAYQMNQYEYQDDIGPGTSRAQEVASGLGYFP